MKPKYSFLGSEIVHIIPNSLKHCHCNKIIGAEEEWRQGTEEGKKEMINRKKEGVKKEKKGREEEEERCEGQKRWKMKRQNYF